VNVKIRFGAGEGMAYVARTVDLVDFDSCMIVIVRKH